MPTPDRDLATEVHMARVLRVALEDMEDPMFLALAKHRVAWVARELERAAATRPAAEPDNIEGLPDV